MKPMHIAMALLSAAMFFVLAGVDVYKRQFLYGGALLGFSGALLSLILSEILVLRLSSAVAEVAQVFGTKFDINGLSFDECLLLLLVCSMIGWVAAWLATVQHLRHFTPE